MAGPGLPTVSDAELMCLIQDGDAVAFAELYDRLAPRACAIAHGLVGARVDRASDALQYGFLSLWRNRAGYRADRGAVDTWVLAIVRNRAIDSLRRNGPRDRRRADGDGPDHALAAPDDVHADAVAGDDGRRLRALLADLPESQREVIALAYFGQLTHTEISARLALPMGTVKGRMRLGLVKLRRELAG